MTTRLKRLLAIVVVAAVARQGGVARAASGADNSAHPAYDAGWADGPNGGAGFGPWILSSEATGDGFAGFYRQSDATEDHGIDNVGQTDPDLGSAWASYANKGSGIDRATAYRALSNPLDGAGDVFRASYENGYVNGLAGIALRNGNSSAAPGDFATGARSQFYFSGGSAGYTLEDAAGAIELDGQTAGLPFVPFTFFGVDVEYEMTGANTYDISITKYNSAAGSGGAAPDVFDKSAYPGLGGRTLAGTGPIDSVALFQQDTETQSDAYFNKLAYSTASGGGTDDASDFQYTFGWDVGVNGGTGFGPWDFAAETSGGFAGQYIQGNPGNGVDNIGTSGGAPTAPDGTVWASYANKGDFADKSTQYRDFINPLSAAGDSFSVSFEHGYIDPGGKIGVSLRDRAVDPFNETSDGFADQALFQFFFEGGDDTYTLVDASGEVDTGVGFSFWGVDLAVTLTSPTTYDLDITRYGEANDTAPVVTTLADLTFVDTLGDGSIESLAFFNQDAPTQSDVYFNNLSYTAVDGAAGDFDADGDVDGADFLAWQRGYPADFDANDLADWQGNFAAVAGGATVGAVPEPAGRALAVLAVACVGLATLRARGWSAMVPQAAMVRSGRRRKSREIEQGRGDACKKTR